ncbi:MAG: hypothetical protein GX591_01655 [Planctomycetes bacterium]|nr:hypothetical protein [Planctomycetota bacterium]
MKTLMMLLVFACAAAALAAPPESSETSRQWTRGLPVRSDYFPIAVWLQSPANAAKYKAAGINLYVGLWEGPTAEQLEQLRAAGMPVICDQNTFALENLADPIFVGWMHGDEPDNAQADGQGGWGPPVEPSKIVTDYHEIRRNDPTRPVMLNLGQGVAWDGWHGRGVRTNHPEDYAQYVQGGDILSFDIYPAVHDNKDIVGQLHYVPYGVERLIQWTEGKKIVWNCIEASRIGNLNLVPTGEQIRSEVWMSIIQGSRGLIYFVHQFRPTFNEDSLLDDPKLLEAVTAVNRQVHALAPVINSTEVVQGAEATSRVAEVPLTMMARRYDGATYVFAAAMRNRRTLGTFKIPGLKAGASVEVIGEDRTLTAADGSFRDLFDGYDVHLYKIAD